MSRDGPPASDRTAASVTQSTLHLHSFPGGDALPAFRAQALLAALQAAVPRVTGVAARFVHWVAADDPADLKAFTDVNRSAMAKDRDGNPVFMAKSAWEVGYVAERYPKVRFLATRER